MVPESEKPGSMVPEECGARTMKQCCSVLQDIYINIQNHLAIHHEVFTAGALEARVRRTSAFRAPAGKTE